ncbi:hotdog family protein [Natronococcus roseus]|uniref:dehydratase n=1 Tax=Natronococcus roseus TaxID=1052014 RepID=UPI00374D714A
MHRPTEDETHGFERTFTTEEVRQFAELSRGTQPRHIEPDEEGRLLIHGLLTATVPTKIGGDLEVLASSMSFEFRRPVYTEERIVCTWSYEELEDRYDLVAAVDCENDAGETVLTATVEGLVWK